MTTYVEIVVNLAQVSGVYHYHLPEELEGQVAVGSLVIAPFGSRTVQGVVLRFVEYPGVSETRPVLDVVDTQAVLTPQQLLLAEHLANTCLSPLAACVALMLPPGIEQHADVMYSPLAGLPDGLTKTQERLLNLLNQRGPLRGSQIDRSLPRTDWRASARALVRRGLITAQPVLKAPSVRPKMARFVQLACSPALAEKALPDLGRPGSQALQRRQAMLRFLLSENRAVNVAWAYAASGGNLTDLRYLEQRGLVSFQDVEVLRDPLEQVEFQPSTPPTLTREQKLVWREVQQRLEQSGNTQPLLLYGVTSSGKTEIYLHAVQETLAQGRQAIVLVPEIALTPQTVRRFMGRFPGRVGLIHSGLSEGERYDTWRRARAGTLSLVVGPRSALFTPFANLGLVVVDECHDESFYQSESAPYYHAREAAVAYARLCGAVCLLGSATPDVVSSYRGEKGEWITLRLPSRILAHREAVRAQMARLQTEEGGTTHTRSRYQPLEEQAETLDLPPVHVVDMRQELRAGNRSIFSRSLQQGLQQALAHGEQAILFLNRRGTATYIFCRDCGYVLKCPRCEIPLTFHEDRHALLCHYCAYQRQAPAVCPQCKSQRIRQYGTGTQKVEAEVHNLFPQARTIRWDYETTRKKGAHDQILRQFSEHKADILVGTQMLAKGLDLPLVTLVGAVLADVGLNLPDYRANERTFQVLTQVAGRAGRSPLGGQVILQTFQPEHYVIQAAAHHDYPSFYQQELAYRKKLGYPPFTQLVRLEYRHHNPEKAELVAREMATRLSHWLAEEGKRTTRIIGPAPCFFGRTSGVYRWQIVLSGSDPAQALRGRNLTDWRVEVNPPSLL